MRDIGGLNNEDLTKKIEKLKSETTELSSIVNNYGEQITNAILPLIDNESIYNTSKSTIKVVSSLATCINSEISQTMKYIMLGLEKGLGFSDTLESIKKALCNIDFSKISRLSGYDSIILDKYYWVIPFEYKYEDIEKLAKLKTRPNFEKSMIKYFNRNRTKRLFSKVRKNCTSKDKKTLMKQVEKAYFEEEYAVCIVPLITLLDGLTLQLIDSQSKDQHLSYKVINDLLEYMKDAQISQFGYELYIKVDIMNNFYNKLYKFDELKIPKRRLLSRHLIAHGSKYVNKKIEVLRVLNAIYLCQEIIEESQMHDKFTKDKKSNRYKVVLDNKTDNKNN